ncbi:MAG: SpoIVB peptidase [Halanaerobiales bacterium]
MNKKFGIGLFVIAIIFLSLSYYFIINGIPASFSIVKGDESTVKISFPFNLYVYGKNESDLTINGQRLSDEHLRLNPGEATVLAEDVGSSSLSFKLFGIIPIKTITVNVLPEINVYPGGQAIGVLLRSRGVMVVGSSYVEDEKGDRFYPAREAGIVIGDRIIEVNSHVINDKMKLANEIQKTVENGSREVEFLIAKKDGSQKTIKIEPVRNQQGLYMIGLYVDDGVAGVGTLTFINPANNEYGALGHEIIETNSQNRIEVREGKIIEAQISGIHSGQRGLPGEKLGTFFQTENVIGEISKNNQFGIFGTLSRNPVNPYFKEPIPVAAGNEVKRGAAKIYTVIKGGKIEEFNVNIEKIYHQSMPNEKGMVINITDPELRQVTGGIIQGMSGSPIVQNNKLVGAVTHVFVNEPTKGYGIFAEWMLLQTDSYSIARTN